MTADGTEPEPIPEDVLLYAALCEALLDFTVSLVLGGDDESRAFIESRLVSWTRRDKKVRMLRELFVARRPDVASEAPYDRLLHDKGDLGALFRFRDKIARWQPDHGDRFHRLRRHHGVEERVTVTRDDIAEQIDLGMGCHSALAFIPEYLSTGLGR